MRMGLGLGLSFVSGGGAAFTPASLSGLQLWLRSDIGVTVATGVSAWADQSGNGRNATQSTGSQQPLYSASDAAFGGKPSIQGDGVDDYLEVGHAIINGAQSATLYFVIRLVGSAYNGSDVYFGDTASVYGAAGFGVLANAGFPEFGLKPGAGSELGCYGPNSRDGATGSFVFSTRVKSGDMQFFENGTGGTQVTTSWAGAKINSSRNKFLFAQNNNLGGVRFTNVKLGQVLVYAAASDDTAFHDNATRAQVEAYLNAWAGGLF